MPQLCQQLFFGHDPLMIPNQIQQNIKSFGLKLTDLPSTADLKDITIELVLPK
jgi:hypothetical protein